MRPVVKLPSIIVLVHNKEQYRPEGFSWDCPPACDGEGARAQLSLRATVAGGRRSKVVAKA